MGRSLDSEISYFNAHADSIREEAESRGKHVVVIHDRTVRGFYDSVVEAANAGYEEFGPEPFLARAVVTPQFEPAIASIFTTR